MEYYHAAKLILVDMPIGLPEGKEERHSDPEARDWLESRKATVFRAPTRQAMTYLADNPGDRDGAKRVQQCITDTLLTNQTLELMPKINAVDRVMQSRNTNANPEIREVHPEICFWALNNRHPMNVSKRDETGAGIEERLCVLKRVDERAREIFTAGRSKFPSKAYGKYLVADDDIIDALAAAVTAWHGSLNQLKTLPKNPQPDGKGLTMEMVFWHPQAP